MASASEMSFSRAWSIWNRMDSRVPGGVVGFAFSSVGFVSCARTGRAARANASARTAMEPKIFLIAVSPLSSDEALRILTRIAWERRHPCRHSKAGARMPALPGRMSADVSEVPVLRLTLMLLGSIALLSALIAAIATLQRRFFWVRQLAFPLYVAAAVATLKVFTLVEPGYEPAAMAQALHWGWLFLGLIAVFRLLGLYLFDVHLAARRGMSLPPLLPAVAMTLVYLITAFVSLRLTFPKLDVA